MGKSEWKRKKDESTGIGSLGLMRIGSYRLRRKEDGAEKEPNSRL